MIRHVVSKRQLISFTRLCHLHITLLCIKSGYVALKEREISIVLIVVALLLKFIIQLRFPRSVSIEDKEIDHGNYLLTA